MLFKIYHIQNKPIDILERDLFVKEWREKSSKLLEIKPASGDDIAWQAISDELDKIEYDLRARYKCQDEWNITSIEEMIKITESYGTTSICIEDGQPVIYLMDLPAQQKVENEAV
jgi:hypothetical protein